MNDTMLFGYIFGGVWCGVGLIFLLIGFFMYRARKSKEKKCVAVTSGTVTDIEFRYSIDNQEGDRPSYYPVFEYDAEGQHYRIVSNVGTSKQKFYVGQSVTICYDPKKPKSYYVKDYKISKTIGYIFLAIGGICLSIGAFAFIYCLKLN